MAAAGFLFAQGSTNGLLADHRRLIDALDILADDINQLTDQLYFLDLEQSRLRADLQNEHNTAATGFMAMLRLSMSHRPSVLVEPSAAIDTARARALLANIRPDKALNEQQTIDALDQLQTMQQRRKDAFEYLSRAEAQYDALQLAVTKLLTNASLDAPITGQAEKTYLTEVDRILGVNANDIVNVDEQQQNQAVQPSAQMPIADDPVDTAPEPILSRPQDLQDWTQGQSFSWPLENPRIVSGFGSTRASRQFRQGLVIETTKEETTIVAPFSGQIIFSDQLDGFQHVVILQHSQSVVSIISGLQGRTVRTGQWLYQGDPIGAISNADGRPPRIFWQIRQGTRLVNPQRWVN